MAIVKMDKISVIGLSTQRADVLSELQKIGRMEIVAPEKDKELQFVDNGAIIAELDGQMAQLERAIEALQTHVPQKGGMLSTRRQVTGEELGAIVTRREELLSQAGAIIAIADTMPTEGEEKDAAISKITELSSVRKDLELLFDRLNLRRDKLVAMEQVGETEYTFLIEGYLPKKLGAEVQKQLEERFTVHVELTSPTAEESVPVAFKNNAFVSPVESITETYAMPNDTDVDPNPIMAFFYYFFFGMMFSDAGYGLLLMLVCGYVAFMAKAEQKTKKNFRMFFFCGVSTFGWGLLFGGFFGNVIHTVSGTFFGREISLEPLWMNPIENAMDLLLLSIGIGIVHLIVALSLKFFVLVRRGKIIDAICDEGSWILIISGIGVFVVGMLTDTTGIQTVGMIVGAVGLGILIVFGGRKSRGVGKLFGIFKLYKATSYISDALSYCRLMALGLATGAIANVFNLLGTMFGTSVFGILLFIVVFAVGHGMNFAMNLLGAYVHTNRLQYVEFFGKFYEGGGRAFSPFRMNTKYVTLKGTKEND